MAITQKFAIYEEDTTTGIGHLTAVAAAAAKPNSFFVEAGVLKFKDGASTVHTVTLS